MAFALAMDCFAVSIAAGVILKRIKWRPMLLMALSFGLFQAVNPIIGWVGTDYCRHLIESVDHWIAFILLGIIGGNMIKESFHRDECCSVSPDFSVRTMLPMAVATSIDAFAIGVSFAFLRVNIWTAVLLIGITTALFSGCGVMIGNVFGNRYKSKAEFAGGFILIAMGLKILIDHVF